MLVATDVAISEEVLGICRSIARGYMLDVRPLLLPTQQCTHAIQTREGRKTWESLVKDGVIMAVVCLPAKKTWTGVPNAYRAEDCIWGKTTLTVAQHQRIRAANAAVSMWLDIARDPECQRVPWVCIYPDEASCLRSIPGLSQLLGLSGVGQHMLQVTAPGSTTTATFCCVRRGLTSWMTNCGIAASDRRVPTSTAATTTATTLHPRQGGVSGAVFGVLWHTMCQQALAYGGQVHDRPGEPNAMLETALYRIGACEY